MRPDRLWGPPILLYNGYRVIPGGKAAGAARQRPTPIWLGGKKSLEFYLYSLFGGFHGLLEGELYLTSITLMSYTELRKLCDYSKGVKMFVCECLGK